MFFEKCIQFLINQTLRDIEILFVLDCPTDGSDKLVEYYALKDTRIKIIYNEINIHAGLSRNIGMDMATGEYIGYHDADDYSEPQMYNLTNTGKSYRHRSVRNRIAFFEGLNSFFEKNKIDQDLRFSYLSSNAARSLY